VRADLARLVQRAYFFGEEDWEVLGVHHEYDGDDEEGVEGTGGAKGHHQHQLHVEAIPEEAEDIGFPAFKFVFAFTRSASDDANAEEEALCVGCYAYDPDLKTFVMLSQGLDNVDGVAADDLEFECTPLFYKPS